MLNQFPNLPRPKQPLTSELSRWNTTSPPTTQPRKRNYNNYSDEEKAKAIVVVKATSLRRAAFATNIPKQTLSDWTNGRGINDRIREMATHYAEELASRLEYAIKLAVEETIDNLQGKRVKQYDLNNLLSYGIDKLLVLRGDPNQITHVTDEDKRARLDQIRAKVRGESDDKQ